jgi:hypothetical protein
MRPGAYSTKTRNHLSKVSARPRFSVVLLGILLGLTIFLTFVFALGQEPLYTAQASAYPLPLATAAQTLAVVGEFSLVASGLPEAEVYLPFELPTAAALPLLRGLAASYNLGYCLLESGVVLLGPNIVCDAPNPGGLAAEPGILRVDDAGTTGLDRGSLDAATIPATEAGPKNYVIRLRLLEISDRSTWGASAQVVGAFGGALAGVLAGDTLGSAARFGAADFSRSLALAESEGIARQLDDISAAGRSGRTVALQSGGNISVNLVGPGEQSIQSSYAYGLSVTVTPESLDDGALLAVNVDSSTPVSVSDPTLLNINSRNISSFIEVGCGQAVVLASLFRLAEDVAGSGVPGLGSVPAVGYLFGSANTSYNRSSLVLTLELACQ